MQRTELDGFSVVTPEGKSPKGKEVVSDVLVVVTPLYFYFILFHFNCLTARTNDFLCYSELLIMENIHNTLHQ